MKKNQNKLKIKENIIASKIILRCHSHHREMKRLKPNMGMLKEQLLEVVSLLLV